MSNDIKDPMYSGVIDIEGHEGAYHVEDSFVYEENRFYICQNDEYSEKTADIIIDENKNVIAEDLWNGFDHDAVMMIRDHLKEKGIDMPYSMIPARERFVVNTIFPDPYSDDYKFAVYDAKKNRPYTGGTGPAITNENRNIIGERAAYLNHETKEVYDYCYRDSDRNKTLHRDLMRKSYAQNTFCAREMTEMVNKSFDGMHLDTECVDRMLEAYGTDRVGYILASTVKHFDWDGRFSSANKTWAQGFFEDHGLYYDKERTMDYCVTSHPAVLDGAITAYREKAAFYKAVDLIETYNFEEFGLRADFSNLEDIGVAFTTIDNEDLGLFDIPIQATVDLKNFRLIKDVGYCEEPFIQQYDSLEDLISNELYGLDFGDLTCIDDDEWQSVYEAEEKGTFDVEIISGGNNPVINEEEIPAEELPGYANMSELAKDHPINR